MFLVDSWYLSNLAGLALNTCEKSNSGLLEIINMYLPNKLHLHNFFTGYARILEENILNIWHQGAKPAKLLWY
jgi:hypothetical protein